MRSNKLALYLHLVWSTWDRQPLITPAIERRLHRCIESAAQKQGCTVIALNGVEDHIHLLVSLPTTTGIANLVRNIKGGSSYSINEILGNNGQFKWQAHYAAFTVSRWDLETVAGYIHHQKEHHAAGTIQPEYEELSGPSIPYTSIPTPVE